MVQIKYTLHVTEISSLKNGCLYKLFVHVINIDLTELYTFHLRYSLL
jgi:hypothetical protein